MGLGYVELFLDIKAAPSRCLCNTPPDGDRGHRLSVSGLGWFSVLRKPLAGSNGRKPSKSHSPNPTLSTPQTTRRKPTEIPSPTPYTPPSERPLKP